eukprot:TRINITY_DN7971_c0_g1_i1.p1 TRINITY_DN7971_c0_g1~~TRINITY_DN7971_c0_g1_i1.p1  ORF type:complete len:382 (+),score=24.73 TRINITY_DN7971_c0_g1_i1:76-1221(+)
MPQYGAPELEEEEEEEEEEEPGAQSEDLISLEEYDPNGEDADEDEEDEVHASRAKRPRLRELSQSRAKGKGKSGKFFEHVDESTAHVCSDLPMHWSLANGAYCPSQGWIAAHITDNKVLKHLNEMLSTDGRQLGKGRDVQEPGDYSELVLARAWRLENPRLWRRYSNEINDVRRFVRRFRSKKIPPIMDDLRQEVTLPSLALPGDELCDDINEIRLFHGTKPELVLSMLQNGMNSRYTSNTSMFGAGVYLAEDAGKTDQYSTSDSGAGHVPDLSDLHCRLYRQGVTHPRNVFYVFICRVIMGYFVRGNTGHPDEISLDDEDVNIYANADRRELSTIPRSVPPTNHHGLLIERGSSISRYREFVQFHDERIYPEYLVAYQRL